MFFRSSVTYVYANVMVFLSSLVLGAHCSGIALTKCLAVVCAWAQLIWAHCFVIELRVLDQRPKPYLGPTPRPNFNPVLNCVNLDPRSKTQFQLDTNSVQSNPSHSPSSWLDVIDFGRHAPNMSSSVVFQLIQSIF